jgi:hypothetical protein
MKKSFKTDNPALAFINTHDTLEEQETQETQQEHKTPGRKQKLQRINMAFSPDNLDYLQRISRLKGVSMTSYTNELIKSDCRANKGLIDKANELLKGAK